MPTTVITGGTGGMGVAAASRILHRWPDRHVALIDNVVGAATPAALDGHGDRVRQFSCDVADSDSVARTVQAIVGSMPTFDSVVNGAGIVSNDASKDVPVTLFRRMMGIHLEGTLHWSQALAKSLDGQPGSIVNIGSVAGQFAVPRRAAYAAAKAAVHSLTKTLAAEWAPLGIRVNAVAPGYIATPMMNEVTRLGKLDRSLVASWHAMKRLGTPEEVADAIVFLLSPESSYITGHILNVDGGFAVLKAEDPVNLDDDSDGGIGKSG